MDHEGLGNRRLVELLVTGRRFRLPGGTGVILGRDRDENAVLKSLDVRSFDIRRTDSGEAESLPLQREEFSIPLILSPKNVPGPTALLPVLKSEDDLTLAKELVCAYSKYDRLQGDIVLAVGPAGGALADCAVPRPYGREKFKAYQIC